MPTQPTPCLSKDRELHGFVVRAVSLLPELFLVAYELEHLGSGARLMLLHADDAENLFSVNFPTPPPDDTGLPHILEHAVLAGSRQYPVRDPFFEMYKMSMATFINAMTGKDCTYYPVCSNVRTDLFNLAAVYFDAVFHPLLTRETFQREGHHLAPADPQQPAGALIHNGIVYNEMKAAYAEPESLLWRDMCRNLLPDSCYGRDSGGDPEAIPALTFEQFREFHRRTYHPSNALLVCYGDIEPEAHLRFLAPRLAEFSRQAPQPAPGRQPGWSAPQEAVSYYECDAGAQSRTYLQMSWKVAGGLEAETVLLLNVLGLVLFGDDAAPLKRALVDSGLGSDLTSSGLLLSGADGIFAVGLKGSEPGRFDAFRDLVLSVLRTLCAEGIAPALVESAFRRYRYAVLEIEALRPLRLAQEVVDPWLLGGDPLLHLRIHSLLERCLRRWRETPGLLTELLREQLLENPHRLDQRLVPDPEFRRRAERALAQRLAALRGGMSDAQAEALARRAAELQRQAGVPNSPEALATLPQLARADLPAAPVLIPTRAETLRTGGVFLRNDVFANGVNYLALHLDLEGLPPELWAAVPFYVEAFNKMGAAGQDYAAMARRVSASTGSLSCRGRFAQDALDPGRTRKGLLVVLKALDEQLDEALAVLADKLRAPDPSDRARLRDVATQLLAGLQTGLVSDGQGTALGALRAGMTEAGYLSELAGGRMLFRNVRSLVTDFASRAEAIVQAVLQIDAFLRRSGRVTASFTGGDRQAARARAALEALCGAGIRTAPPAAPPSGFRPFERPPRIGLTAPLQIAHCAQVLPAPHAAHADAPLLQLGMSLLRVDYMISELRFKGNAYGASCAFGGGLVSLSTYADPHICRTLDVFAGLTDYVRRTAWTDAELTRGILSTAKGFVRPLRPEEATLRALAQAAGGLDDEHITAQYEALRAATPQAVRDALLRVFEPGLPGSPVAVVASPEKLSAANRELGEAALRLEPLLAEDA